MKLFSQINLLRFVVPRSAWLDGPILLGLVMLLNGLFARADFGWFDLHPSPYFLVPILIGYRYGFLAGALAGILSAAVILIGRTLLLDVRPETLFAEHGFFFGGLVFLGGLCGEIQNAPRKKELQLTVLYDNAQERLRRMDADLRLLREAKSELERVLATRDAEVANLDTEMRRLFESEGDELYQNLLLLLSRQTRITDGAIYVFEPPDQLERKALVGEARLLPAKVRSGEIEVVRLALKNKAVVTIPEFWREASGTQSEYLLAIPLLDIHEQPLGILVVTGIPFIALNKRTIQLAVLICRWATRIIEIRRRASGAYRVVSGLESQKIFHADSFRQTLELAHVACRLHDLPSSILLFTWPGQSPLLQARFEQVIMGHVRGGDFAAVLDLPVPNLAILLPLTGDRGANIFRERVMVHCRKEPQLGEQLESHLIALDPRRDFEEVWRELSASPKLEKRRPKLSFLKG